VDPVVVNPSILLLSSSLVLGCHLSHMAEERRESHNRCRNIDLSLINKRICVVNNPYFCQKVIDIFPKSFVLEFKTINLVGSVAQNSTLPFCGKIVDC
jgi:hypothetical protein